MSQDATLAFLPPRGSRIAIVGACGGLGRPLVQALAGAGCAVFALDLPASLDAHPVPDGVRRLALDATQEADVTHAFAAIAAEVEALDGLVNLAGFAAPRAPVSETTLGEWQAVVAASLDSTFLCCRAALPLLRRGQSAAVVNTASGLAFKSPPGYGPYSAAKAAVLSLTRTLAFENAPTIRFNAIAPAAVDTAFLRGGTARGGDDASAPVGIDIAAYMKTMPLARLATAADVLGPMLFLLGPASAYMTGHTLHISGGSLML